MKAIRSFTKNLKFSFSKVNMDTLKELRGSTGAPLMKCKEALEKFSDIEKAKEFLKEKNLIYAEKKSSNVSSQGIFSVKCGKKKVVSIRFNSETDFVARNTDFLEFVSNCSEQIFENADLFNEPETILTNSILSKIKMGNGDLLETQKLITAKIQENIKISRVFVQNLGPTDVCGVYVHQEVSPGVGPHFCSVVLEVTGDFNAQQLKSLADEMAVLVFCKRPKYLTLETVDPEELKSAFSEFEKNLDEKLKNEKPEICKEIVKGKIRKRFGEDVLYEQVVDFTGEEILLKDYLKEFHKQNGNEVNIKEFLIKSIH